MTDKEYKKLSLKEFTKAAEVYETDQAGVYKMCKKDYPDVLKELEKLIAKIKKQMQQAAAELNFEAAAELRDQMKELMGYLDELR